jgi:PAS domain S-box-containing protein
MVSLQVSDLEQPLMPDFIHVLSLKGLFQYVSPSVRRVLEYEPEDLLNKNIADICHPSDIVPLMRELKDSTHVSSDGQPSRNVGLVFRIRRKHSGYVWIECAGRLHVEPGKGRKAVILSGRARSVPTLPWDSISKHGGLAENEVWVKMSYQGLILHVTDAANSLLGLRVDDILGQSLYSFLPGGDNGPPSQAHVTTEPNSPFSKLSKALSSVVGSDIRSGGITVAHRMVNKSGKTIDVDTTIYTPVPNASASRDSSEEDSPSIDSESSQSQAAGVAGIQPNTLVAQIKLRTPIPKATRPIVHSASANVFEELETTRGTSWQYELHQLRLLNRRLKEDIQSARSALAKNGGSGKNKKRRAEEAMAGGSGPGGMAPPPIPEALTAAPRHQMAPGFGLVAPGTTYY